MKKTERERLTQILFPASHGMKTDFPWLSKRTGIPERTLRRYKHQPELITVDRLLVIVKEMGITPEDTAYAITGRRTV